MAYTVREERRSLATSLQDDLAEAERVILQLPTDNVEWFLQRLDRIDEHFIQLESSGLDLRPEQTRRGSFHSKLRSEAGRVTRVLDAAGGLEQLHQANPPAWSAQTIISGVVSSARSVSAALSSCSQPKPQNTAPPTHPIHHASHCAAWPASSARV